MSLRGAAQAKEHPRRRGNLVAMPVRYAKPLSIATRLLRYRSQ
jgi:hypothetical protein